MPPMGNIHPQTNVDNVLTISAHHLGPRPAARSQASDNKGSLSILKIYGESEDLIEILASGS